MDKIACVILPTFNEAQNVELLISQIFDQSGMIATHDLHVVVVDDDSPDGTSEVIRGLMTTFPNLHLSTGKKKGLGEAYKRGIAYASNELGADLILQMDADFQHDPGLLPLFVTLTNYGFSLVIGSRFVSGGATPNFPWYRKVISLTGTWLVRQFGNLPPLTDCTSGYRCIKAQVVRKCDLSGLATRGYSFQSSLLCELLRNGARVIEVPIIFNERQRGTSKLSFQDQVEFLSNLPKLRNKASDLAVRPVYQTPPDSPGLKSATRKSE